MAMDEARLGLISWHKRRYRHKGERPSWVVRRRYEWSWLYTAIEPTSGEDFCLYLSALDGVCFEVFLQHLGERLRESDNPASSMSEILDPQSRCRSRCCCLASSNRPGPSRSTPAIVESYSARAETQPPSGSCKLWKNARTPLTRGPVDLTQPRSPASPLGTVIVLVLDNAPAHRCPGERGLSEHAGLTVLS